MGGRISNAGEAKVGVKKAGLHTSTNWCRIRAITGAEGCHVITPHRQQGVIEEDRLHANANRLSSQRILLHPCKSVTDNSYAGQDGSGWRLTSHSGHNAHNSLHRPNHPEARTQSDNWFVAYIYYHFVPPRYRERQHTVR